MRGSSISELRYSSWSMNWMRAERCLPSCSCPKWPPPLSVQTLLEGGGDPVYVVGEQPRKGEEAERIEERELMIGEFHFFSFSYSAWGFDPGVRSKR